MKEMPAYLQAMQNGVHCPACGVADDVQFFTAEDGSGRCHCYSCGHTWRRREQDSRMAALNDALSHAVQCRSQEEFVALLRALRKVPASCLEG